MRDFSHIVDTKEVSNLSEKEYFYYFVKGVYKNVNKRDELDYELFYQVVTEYMLELEEKGE